MFEGLDEVDWASMEHAYGPATEVPDLLRGLVDPDPAVRESALEGMYGTVHHQGDVYECTVATIPLLLEAVAAGSPGRDGVLGLLASYAEVGDGIDDECCREVGAARGLFLGLLDDGDPRVRRAVPPVLRVCGGDARPVVAALRARLPEEGDPEARLAIVESVGALADRKGVDRAGVVAWLAGLTGQDDPVRAASALAQLARLAPAELPADLASPLPALYDADARPEPPAGFPTDAPREREGGFPHRAGLIRDLSTTLDDRVVERIGLLTSLLRSPSREARGDALGPASVLVSRWRGDYRELVALVGDQLDDPATAVRAAKALEHWDELAAPAADALARALDAEQPVAEANRAQSPGPVLRALVGLLDERALPALRRALERPEPPRGIGGLIGAYGPVAADFVPLFRARLRDPRLLWAAGALGGSARLRPWPCRTCWRCRRNPRWWTRSARSARPRRRRLRSCSGCWTTDGRRWSWPPRGRCGA
ncbi:MULTISPECIES: hypothetical protein [Actinosynnema]|uniref:hypothetical protein n=1 Tax=Actinosynnema TaxID=40566 RepID=UPI0020A316E3|nr:hypothetical protein [Actinosynnema pretiosum]MCP2094559.1 hypothetical protein [Actinosynnema pretiosum]